MVFERIKQLIIEELNIDADKITMDARLVEDLEADSLDAVELIMKLEEEYNIQIDDTSAESIKTVGDLVRYIENSK